MHSRIHTGQIVYVNYLILPKPCEVSIIIIPILCKRNEAAQSYKVCLKSLI